MMPQFGTAVQDYYLDLVRKNFNERKRRLETLRTKEDAERYVADVRAKILRLFPLPAEKTPLHAEERGKVEFDSFVMHRIIYQSRPGFPVTGNLYLPKKDGKVPGVLFLCGHSSVGKASDVYQTAARSLAMMGYAVFIIDPVSQGERLQYPDVPGFSGVCCTGHNIMGKQLLLTGETMGAWRAWDAIRGLDYLLSRPEVDPARVGLTGNSGGGTMTTFVGALEDRFVMTAPSCYITSWLHNVENELPADSEQMPPGTLAAGLEMGDFLIARAPRPLVILGQKNDFFDPRGTAETYDEVRRIYRLLGAEDSVRLTIGPDSHGYSKTNREAMYSLFNDTLHLAVSSKEPASVPVSSAEELACAPGGQVANLPWNRCVRSFALEKAEALAAARKPHTKEELCAILKKHLGLDEVFVPHWRVLRPILRKEFFYSRFGLETEPDSRLMCVLKLKRKGDFYHLPDAEKIMLYIPHLDAQEELASMHTPENEFVYGLDVRGIGECAASGCVQPEDRNFFAEYQADYHYASLGLMFAKPYLGGKVKDILCAVELLAQSGAEITMTAAGQGTVPALIAALLSDKIRTLKLEGGPESWEAIIRKPVPEEAPLSFMLPGILAETDLPEIRAAIREKLI